MDKFKQDDTEMVLKLYGLVTFFQNTQGIAQRSVQAEISELLRGYTQEELIQLKEKVMVLAAEVITGSAVVMMESNNTPPGYASTQARKQIREAFLKEKVSSLTSNLSKADLMKVVRAYHAPEQLEISFFNRPDESKSQFFGFRGATFAMRYATEEEFKRGKSPISLDHVGGELNLGRQKKNAVADSPLP